MFYDASGTAKRYLKARCGYARRPGGQGIILRYFEVIKMDDYKNFAQDYEALNPKEEIILQRDFFSQIIEKYNVKTCLDCACGLGWHLYMINNLGVKSCGSDISPEMIDICKDNLRGTNIELRIEDYCKLSETWERKFDMILCVSSALNHMLEDEDIIRALDSMYERLEENGIVVMFSGISDLLARSRPKLIPARTYQDEAIYHIIEYFDDRVVFNILDVKKTKDSFTHSLNSMALSLLTKARFEGCLSRTKFANVNIFGDFDFSMYSEDKSNRLFAILQK
ncbi:MAG: class I SAM-dependent methyltransferase [Dehalobacter sp. 4CP]|nr:class I SAM-dependent methyltransferase [Dehalobacter sp. 4CP]